jgi:hypothetical protein
MKRRDLPRSMLPAVDASALREAIRSFPILLDAVRIGVKRGAPLVECVSPHYYEAIREEYRRVVAVRDRTATLGLR